MFDKRLAAIRRVWLEGRRQRTPSGIGHLLGPISEEDHGHSPVDDGSGSTLAAAVDDRDCDQA